MAPDQRVLESILMMPAQTSSSTSSSASGSARQQRSQDARSVPRARLLIVDEDPVLSGLARQMLEGEGYEVVVLAKPLGLDALMNLVGQLVEGGSSPASAALQTATAALTRRELEVARLVARGYSNKRLAEALVVTQGTAANHVAHILTKLGLVNRTQIGVWAAAEGLLQSGT